MLIAAIVLNIVVLVMEAYGLITSASYGKTLTYHDMMLPLLAVALLLALIDIWMRRKKMP